MAEETKRDPLLLKEHSRGESRALNISLRGWISLIIVITFCYCVVIGTIEPKDTIATTMMVLAFYFSTKPPGKEPEKPRNGEATT